MDLMDIFEGAVAKHSQFKFKSSRANAGSSASASTGATSTTNQAAGASFLILSHLAPYTLLLFIFVLSSCFQSDLHGLSSENGNTDTNWSNFTIIIT
jgi:hypothetical protein